jgi:hypothetical protein
MGAVVILAGFSLGTVITYLLVHLVLSRTCEHWDADADADRRVDAGR